MRQFWKTSLFWGLLSILAFSPTAQGAERLRLRYGPLERSLPVSSLSQLVATGETSRELAQYLDFAHQSPEKLRRGLSASLPAEPSRLDRLLNSPMGEALLKEMSHYIHTSQRSGSPEALRSAFILSANDDHRVSLMEILQHYPTSDVTVEGDKVLQAYRNVNRWVGRGQAILPIAQDLAQQVNVWLK